MGLSPPPEKVANISLPSFIAGILVTEASHTLISKPAKEIRRKLISIPFD